MKKKILKDISASARQRLLNISRENKEDFQYNLTRYAIERFLFRLSKSVYLDRFILKGAQLFSLWGIKQYRQTRDVDFLGYVENNIVETEKIFKEICSISAENDGLVFDESSVVGEQIRDTQDIICLCLLQIIYISG